MGSSHRMFSYCSHIVTGLGLLGALTGTLTVIFYQDLYDAILKGQLAIREGSYRYDLWRKAPIPMFNKIYLFNCTNSEEVMADPKNVKPLLKQVGPYTFFEEHEKTNISFNDDYTVEFFQKKMWHFMPERSNGSLDDEIFTINMIALAAAEVTRWPNSFADGDYPFMRYVMNETFYLNNERLFIKARVGNITFDGIDSPLLHMGDVGGMLGDAINQNVPYDRFGWFYDRNESELYDGRYKMFTGKDDIYKVGQIAGWQNHTDFGYLYPEPCDVMTGSAGEFFPKNRDKTSLSYFTPDLCRPIHFNFAEETEFMGVHGYWYILDQGLMGNSSYNASNWCYNPQPDLVPNDIDWSGHRNDSHAPLEDAVNMVLPTGLLNVSSCKFDSDSDLSPSEELHSNYITIMPEQGIPLDVAIRLQINILYPAVWMETTTELTEDLAAQMRFLDNIVPRLGDIIGYSSIGLGLSMALLGGFLLLKGRLSTVVV